MKKIIQIFIAILFIAMLAWPVVPNAQAEDAEKASDTSDLFDCKTPAETQLENMGADCISNTERKEYIVTMLEEGFGDEMDEGDKKIRPCVRASVTIECVLKGANTNPETPIPTTTVTKYTKTCTSNATTKCEKVMFLLAKSGTDLIELYISQIYKWAVTIAGIVCVLIMIVSGIQISAAGGEATAVESAKKRIFQSLTALVVLFLSAFILYIINPGFFTL